jgi:hypothetical protein
MLVAIVFETGSRILAEAPELDQMTEEDEVSSYLTGILERATDWVEIGDALVHKKRIAGIQIDPIEGRGR